MKKQRKKDNGSLTLMMRPLLAFLLLMMPLGGVVRAQDPVHTPDKISVRLSGGVSWSLGGGLANAKAYGAEAIQPLAGAGVTIKVAPRIRVGAGYDYSRMVRQQLNGQLDPISDNTSPGSVEGTVYRDFKTLFHAAGITAECNLLPAGGPVSLYVGTGAGCLFATGNTWSLSVRNEIRSDNGTNTVSIGGHNEPHRYLAPFIPASLSLECRILPRTALCLGGIYRYILSKEPLAPKGQAGATLGLRLDF